MQTHIIKWQACHAHRPERFAVRIDDGPVEARGGQRQDHNGGRLAYGCSRLCRHVVSGRIQAPKICVRNDECYHCAFDQMLDALDGTSQAKVSTNPAFKRYRAA